MRRIDRWATPPGWRASDGCIILDCGRPGIARGMCWNHYQRARRGGPVFVYLKNGRGGSRTLTVARFGPARPSSSFLRMNRIAWEVRENVTWEPNTGCALWLGKYSTFKRGGYGWIGDQRDPWGRWAHRAVLWFAGVRFERGDHKRHVRHTCNQPACYEPRSSHLRDGRRKYGGSDAALPARRTDAEPRSLSRRLRSSCPMDTRQTRM